MVFYRDQCSDLELIQQYYKESALVIDSSEGEDSAATLYELREPEKHSRWSVEIAPMSSNLVLSHLFEGAEDFLPLSVDEKIIGIDFDTKYILFKIEFTTESKLQYSVVIDCLSQHFTIDRFLKSIENTGMEPMKTDIEKQQEAGYWMAKDNHPLQAQALFKKLTQLLSRIDVQVQKNASRADLLRGQEVSRQSQGRSESPTSVGQQTPNSGRASRAKPRRSAVERTPVASQVATGAEPESSSRRGRGKKALVPASTDMEISTASAMTEIAKQVSTGEEPDFDSTTQIFEKYWTDCSDCYVFSPPQKKELSVYQLIQAPEDWTIRSIEEEGVNKMVDYLVKKADKTDLQTLCVMPAATGIEITEANWDKFRTGKFYIINGQHSVAASKRMIERRPPVEEQILKYFRTWNCYIVFTNDKEKLRKISAFYNRTNHFTGFLPTWSTNILGARALWTNNGRPKAPKTLPAANTTRTLSTNDAAYMVSLVQR